MNIYISGWDMFKCAVVTTIITCILLHSIRAESLRLHPDPSVTSKTSLPYTMQSNQSIQPTETRQQYYDVANSIVYGLDNSIYVSGYNWNPSTSSDWYIISLDTSGIANWVYCYNGAANWQDIGLSIVCGGDSHIYSAGYITHNPYDWDFTVISMTDTGATNWIYRYDSPQDMEIASSIIYGLDSNIYASGHIEGNGNDILVVSLTQFGDTNWTYCYNNLSNLDDVSYAITCGLDSIIYVCGYTNSPASGRDIFTLSLDTSGDSNWTYTYNGPGNSADEAHAIAFGLDGNLYIAGYCTGINTGKDLIVASLDTDGDTNWIYVYDGPINADDWGSAICYGADGNIYAVGSCSDSAQWWVEKNLVAVSLTSSGVLNWTYIYDGGDSDDEASSVVYGADGNIYVGGFRSGYDALVIKLDVAGDTNWIYTYDGPAGAEDKIYDIVYGADGNIYAAGSSWGVFNNDDLIVISLSQQGSTNWIYRYDGYPGIEEAFSNQQRTDRGPAISIYPQPCTRSATLVFNTLNTRRIASLYLYDAAGRKEDVIWRDYREIPKSYVYHIPAEITSGIYYLVLNTDGPRYAKRLLVIR